MNLLRCTQKLLKNIGLSPQELVENRSESTATLGNWYANLLQISKRKVIIFTSEKTLFSFFVLEGTKSNPLRLKTALQEGLKQALLSEGIEEILVNKLCLEYEKIWFAKTENRRILGSMNDLAKMFEFHVYYEEGWEYCNITEITRGINQTPMKFVKYRYPINLVYDILGIKSEREKRKELKCQE